MQCPKHPEQRTAYVGCVVVVENVLQCRRQSIAPAACGKEPMRQNDTNAARRLKVRAFVAGRIWEMAKPVVKYVQERKTIANARNGRRTRTPPIPPMAATGALAAARQGPHS